MGGPSINPLDRARIEKAAADHGFDLTPTLDDDWIVLRSTQMPVTCHARMTGFDRYVIAVSDSRIADDLAHSPSSFGAKPEIDPGKGFVLAAESYGELFQLLGRIAALARCLPTTVADKFREVTARLPRGTEAERWVVTRVGQQLFRDALIDYWQGACAVTGLSVVPLLKASHIKPWSECVSDDERLDVFNGLLLAPNLDALFDGGWVTVDVTGTLVVSSRLDAVSQALLSLQSGMKLRWLANGHRSFLEFHRNNIYVP